MSVPFHDFFTAASDVVTSLPHNIGYFGRFSSQCLANTYLRMHKTLKTDLSLELGAYSAMFSLGMKEYYGDGVSVCAVEGSPKTHAYFSRKIDFAGRNIVYLNNVLSDEDNDVLFYEYGEESADTATQLCSLFIRGVNPPDREQHVRAIKGDTLISNLYADKKSIALWVDVEGAQKEVLASLEETFASGKVNSVYIEVETGKLWPEQSMLVDDIIGYLAQRNLSPFLRDNEYGSQYNILFINNVFVQSNLLIFYKYYISQLREGLENIKKGSPYFK